MQAIVLYPVAENKVYTTLIKEMLEKTGISKDRLARELALSLRHKQCLICLQLRMAQSQLHLLRSQISSMSHSKI